MSITPTLPPLPSRRRLLQGTAVLAAGHPLLQALAQQPAASGEPPRLALLIGNRDYPEGEDLPPIHKNVRDLRAVLEKRGFTVDQGLDLDLAQSRAAVQAFAARVRAAPADCTALFYFSGHGAQVDAENLLLAARANPKARPEVLQRNSLTLSGDVLGPLPNRPAGLTIAVIDACRTSLRDVARGEGLNQVEAPPGKLIAFATGAGRPAIAPADDTRHTFYTASLVKLLESASDEISFSDLFRLVKYDVQNTMLNHPLPLLRRFAQFPFIAENTQLRRRLAPLPPPEVAAAAAPPPPRPRDEAEDFARLEAAIWPAEVARLAEDYLRNHAASPLAGSAIVAREGAREAVKALRSRDVQLFRSAFVPAADGGASERDELTKAGRGDKDAAARIARRHGRRDGGRYEGWLQYASELGNGIAAYELALHYRREAQPLLADRYEKRAVDLGYTPPPSLDNTRK